jgi:hypothetical protein
VNTAQPDQANSRRNNLTLRYTRFLRQRWYAGGSVSAEQNTELGLDLRLAIGGAVARSLVQSNEDWFYWVAGLQGNYENTTGDVPGKFNLEAPAGLTYSKFRYDAPEIDLRSNFTLYTNLTTFGRFRFEFDNSLMWKFIKDFTLNLTLYSSYDNKPPSESAAKFDIGTTFRWDGRSSDKCGGPNLKTFSILFWLLLFCGSGLFLPLIFLARHQLFDNSGLDQKPTTASRRVSICSFDHPIENTARPGRRQEWRR